MLPLDGSVRGADPLSCPERCSLLKPSAIRAKRRLAFLSSFPMNVRLVRKSWAPSQNRHGGGRAHSGSSWSRCRGCECRLPRSQDCQNKIGLRSLKDEKRFAAILSAIVEAVKIPVTVKIRIGVRENEYLAPALAKLAETCGVAAVIVHARPVSRKAIPAVPIGKACDKLWRPYTHSCDRQWRD